MDSTEFATFPLSKHNALSLVAVLGLGAAAHLVFNRVEPREPAALLTLLIVLPGVISTTLLPHFSHWVLAIATTFSTYYLVLVFSTVVYRLSPYHPLARYPGQTLDKISNVWVAFVARRGKRFFHVHELHQKYGNVIRIGPNEISIRDPSIVEALHGTQGLPKGPQHQGRKLKTAIPSLIAIDDRNLHMQRRRHWLRGLNAASLRDYEPIISKRVSQLVEHLEVSSGSTVDLSQMLSYFAYDFMNDMSFGGGIEMMRDGDVHGIRKLQENAFHSAAFFGHIPWFAPFSFLFTYFPGGLSKFRQFGSETAKKRIQEVSETKDLFYHLSDEGGVDEEPPSLEQVLSDGTLAIAAGTETTATTMSNLFFLLMSNRQVFGRLQAEVDNFYPKDENSLSTKYHGDMPYLNACINETLRLFPVVPAGSQRGCYKGMGARMIGSYYIPEGTAVSSHFYATHRDPQNFFPGADTFWPERWLITEGKNDLSSSSRSSPTSSPVVTPKGFVHNMDAFTPFSYGPANCVGKFLALQEMKIVVCHMMQKLELRFAEEYDSKQWIEDLQEHSILRKGRLPVVCSTRRNET